nr:MAG: hypothetical protein [Porcellio scaber clopovirus]
MEVETISNVMKSESPSTPTQETEASKNNNNSSSSSSSLIENDVYTKLEEGNMNGNTNLSPKKYFTVATVANKLRRNVSENINEGQHSTTDSKNIELVKNVKNSSEKASSSISSSSSSSSSPPSSESSLSLSLSSSSSFSSSSSSSSPSSSSGEYVIIENEKGKGK